MSLLETTTRPSTGAHSSVAAGEQTHCNLTNGDRDEARLPKVTLLLSDEPPSRRFDAGHLNRRTPRFDALNRRMRQLPTAHDALSRSNRPATFNRDSNRGPWSPRSFELKRSIIKQLRVT
jgi:hypothetical protein